MSTVLFITRDLCVNHSVHASCIIFFSGELLFSGDSAQFSHSINHRMSFNDLFCISFKFLEKVAELYHVHQSSIFLVHLRDVGSYVSCLTYKPVIQCFAVDK